MFCINILTDTGLSLELFLFTRIDFRGLFGLSKTSIVLKSLLCVVAKYIKVNINFGKP